MSDINELIELGSKIISNYERDSREGTDLPDWKKECVVSAQILLDYLSDDTFEIEKILFLTKIVGDYHSTSKPPAIPFWCRKIREYAESQLDLSHL